jgi:hypothetical protein
LPEQPIFQGNRIKVQYVRTCQPTSAARLLPTSKRRFQATRKRTRSAGQIPVEPIDWLRTLLASSQNRAAWQKKPDILKWLYGARLDGFTAMFVRAEQEARPEEKAII